MTRTAWRLVVLLALVAAFASLDVADSVRACGNRGGRFAHECITSWEKDGFR